MEQCSVRVTEALIGSYKLYYLLAISINLVSCVCVCVCVCVLAVSVVMKGEQMVPVLNKLGIHCAVYGNHDFGKCVGSGQRGVGGASGRRGSIKEELVSTRKVQDASHFLHHLMDGILFSPIKE